MSEAPVENSALRAVHRRVGLQLPPGGWRRRGALLLAIGVGGAVGALLRYGVGVWLPSHSAALPVATLLVNVVGAVVLGWLAARPAGHWAGSEVMRPLIGTGFCGGLTTFSTMSLEIVTRWGAHPALAAGYAAISVAAAPLAVVVGGALQAERDEPPTAEREGGPR